MAEEENGNEENQSVVIDQTKIDALKAIKNSNTFIKLLKDYVQTDPKTALDLLEELGQNMESLGGIDLSKLTTLKGKDGQTPVFGEDYMTASEIDGLEAFIAENVDGINNELAERLTASINTAQTQLNNAISQIQNGKDGVDGKNVTKKDIDEVIVKYKDELKGSPDTPLEIIDKIKRVNGSKKLKLKNIQGLPAIKTRVENNTEEIDEIKKVMITEVQLSSSRPEGGGGSGETNTASNVGGEKEVFKQKTGVNLEFRTLKAGAGVSLTQNTSDIEITATGSGTGDMLKSVYDTGDNGVVDNSEKLEGQDSAYHLARANHTGTQLAATISDFNTAVSANSDVTANTAARHDAVTVSDSAEIDFTLVGQDITASLVAGSIDETKLDASVNASLNLADSASQPGHTHTASNITDFNTAVSANSDVVANTAKVGITPTQATDIGLNNTHRTSNGSDHSYLNQDVQTTASPSFVNATLSGKTSGSVLFAGAGGVISEDNSELSWLANVLLVDGQIRLGKNRNIQAIDSGDSTRNLMKLNTADDFLNGAVDAGWGRDYITSCGRDFVINVNKATSSIRLLTGRANGNIQIGSTTDNGYKVEVTGTFRATGNSLIGGTLGVTGTTTLATANITTLNVTNALDLSSTLDVTGLTTLSTLRATGDVDIGGGTGVARLYVRATGASGSTIAFRLDNSASGLLFQVRDDAKATFAGVAVLGTFSSAPTAAEGGIYYNSTDNHFYGHNGTSWTQLDN